MSSPTSKSPESTPALEAYYRQPELWEPSRYETDDDQCLRARMIASLVEPDVDSILDVGCGNGFITRHLKARRVVGLDPSPEALSHFDGEKVLASADEIPFDGRSFDAVVCSEVLEHLSDPMLAKATAELDRVARTYLIVGVPYRQNLLEGTTRCAKCRTPYHVDLHQRAFRGPGEIQKLFPSFAVRATALVGRSDTMAIPGFSRLCLILLGPRATSVYGRCPQCGSPEQVTCRQEPGRRLRRWLLEAIAWRFRKRQASWMIVLLKRR